MAYQNTGTIGPEDGDALISLKEDHGPTAAYVKALRTDPAAEIPRHDVLLPARRHRLANPQFRTAGADRHPGRRPRPESQLRLRQRSAEAPAPRPGHRRSSHPADLQLSATQCRRRPDAGRRGRFDAARCRQQPAGHALRQRPGEAEFLAQPGKRRVLSDRRADAAIPDQQRFRSVQYPDHAPAEWRRRSTRYLGGLAKISQGPSAGVVSHYNVQPVIDIYADTQGRDLGAVAGDISKDPGRDQEGSAARLLRRGARSGPDHE